MFPLYDRIQQFLPGNTEILWDDWKQQPLIRLEDWDRDGQLEMFVSYFFQDEPYTTVFRHDYKNWYATITYKGVEPYRVKTINLYPASVKGIGGDTWGFINEKGEFVSPIKYEDALSFQENGLAAVKVSGEYGLINRYGQFIVHPQYQYINPFVEGRAVVLTDKGFKVINEWGKEVTRKTYSFIGQYKNKMAQISGTDEGGNFLYGFLNRKGKEVIPLQFTSVTDFHEDKAVVRRLDGIYQLIDRTGRVLQSYEHFYVGPYQEGLLAFQKEQNGKFGYMDESGKVVIEPLFSRGYAFQNDRAVIGVGEDYRILYGLIDKKGQYTIRPIFDEIKPLDAERYAVGKSQDKNNPRIGVLYAIVDSNGNILTDYKFTNVEKFKQGFASVSDGINSYFIDQNGNSVKHLPIVKGNGVFTFDGQLISGNIDMRLRYYTLKGRLVWSQNQIIPLNSRYKVIERKYKPNKDYLVYYPEIQGMRFESVQKKVNAQLAYLAGVKLISSNAQLETSYTGDFEVRFFKKQLVVLEINGYDYPFGAAHGMPVKIFAKVDLETGAFYELKDLFKPGSSYVNVLSDMVAEQIKSNSEYSYVFPDAFKRIDENQPFYMDGYNLHLYFKPYEIAPFAAGYPTFTIPFTDIDKIINKEGAFWRAFH